MLMLKFLLVADYPKIKKGEILAIQLKVFEFIDVE